MLCLPAGKSARGREEILLFMPAKVPLVQAGQWLFFFFPLDSLNTSCAARNICTLCGREWCASCGKKNPAGKNYISTFASLQVCPLRLQGFFDGWHFSTLAPVPISYRKKAASGTKPFLYSYCPVKFYASPKS